jgi:hypothetical protein
MSQQQQHSDSPKRLSKYKQATSMGVELEGT